jgi:hypothetical protein
LHVALEHTFEDVYASAAPAAERPTGVWRRAASADQATRAATTWPFCTPAFVAALDLAHDAVVIVDRTGTIRYSNGAGQALVERSHPEGRHILEVTGVHSSLLRGMLRSLRDTALWHGIATIDIQGKPRELELSVGAVKVDDCGRAHAFSIVARPPLVLRRQSLDLQPRSGARDVFATLARVVGAAAHDFNNHISVVLNYSFILLRELSTERPERTHMEELQQAAWRAAETARQLLRLGGKRGPEPAALDVNDVIRDAHVTLSLISHSHTEIEQRFSQEPCITKARQSELEWLLLELTQRLRSRLGELKHLRIATLHAAPSCDASDEPRICIHLDAFPAPVSQNDAASSRLLAGDPDAESGPRISAQLAYDLTLQALPEDGLRYAIELPAV